RAKETGRLNGSYMPIDFAAHARSLGAASYTARTADELEQALRQAKLEPGPVLVEIKVLPGTNTDSYESWWHVGVPEVSVSDKVLEAHQQMRKNVKAARPY
ncbi:3D-(3,5/4)-trihydroxycyclohexane-1,2-dione acylhydrolase (decyclizing), partial [Paenibacillus sepulcri]|nr:3D-(3,5/4)-trihydroxycyclohexane-1,2-dione acylhydrolase (decyclizing) [Paenibacillus sepulcri]